MSTRWAVDRVRFEEARFDGLCGLVPVHHRRTADHTWLTMCSSFTCSQTRPRTESCGVVVLPGAGTQPRYYAPRHQGVHVQAAELCHRAPGERNSVHEFDFGNSSGRSRSASGDRRWARPGTRRSTTTAASSRRAWTTWSVCFMVVFLSQKDLS